jgi:hypothetical protein
MSSISKVWLFESVGSMQFGTVIKSPALNIPAAVKNDVSVAHCLREWPSFSAKS